MAEKDSARVLVDSVELYQSIPAVYADTDRWHLVTHQWISNFVQTELRPEVPNQDRCVLNLGSGGESYGLPESSLVHVDLHSKWSSNSQQYVIADIHALPFADDSFDACIFVGSVLNHCDAAQAIYRAAEVTKPGGVLILEFETTASLEYLFSRHFLASATLASTFYHGRDVTLWAYSERYILALLSSNGFEVVNRSSKHHLSAAAYLVTRNSNFAARFHVLDGIASRIPGLRALASHVIVACRKSS